MDQPGNHILLRGNQPAAADRVRELATQLAGGDRPDPGRSPAAAARAADPRAAGGQPEASRDGSRDGSGEGSGEGSRI